MIQLTSQTRILIAVDSVDFRKRIDGLAALCRGMLNTDPFSGTAFVFRGNAESRIMWSRCCDVPASRRLFK